MNADDIIDGLTRLLRATRHEVEQLIFSAPHKYKHYTIPKKSGGVRDIYHPASELKAVQRWLSETVLSELPIHDAVCSYRRGMNIRAHAERHLSSNYFLRMDFRNFFPSISDAVLFRYFEGQVVRGNLDCDVGALHVLSRLVCRQEKASLKRGLSIGAPTSPLLSNAVLFDFDERMVDLGARSQCIYTRYADDMFFSCREKDRLGDVEILVKSVVAELLPFLEINEEKTVHSSRKNFVGITGLVVTPERRLSIGRDIKRQIKTETFLWTLKKLEIDKLIKLRGMVAYIRDVEPDFYATLERKFGLDLIKRLNENVSLVEEQLRRRVVLDDDVPF